MAIAANVPSASRGAPEAYPGLWGSKEAFARSARGSPESVMTGLANKPAIESAIRADRSTKAESQDSSGSSGRILQRRGWAKEAKPLGLGSLGRYNRLR